MKGEFLAGAILGAAFIAACYSDNFRATCKQAINGLGEQVNKQISGLVTELKGDMAKEQNNGQGTQTLHAE